MTKFNRANLEEGLVGLGYNPHGVEGVAVRVGTHSVFNHNFTTAKQNTVMGIVEAVPPVSKFTTLEQYEEMMANGYEIRLYRIKSLTNAQREAAAQYFVNNLLGLPYPRKRRMVMLALPITNFIIDTLKISTTFLRQTWCSQLVKIAFTGVEADCLDGRNHKKKQLFTPRTFENRILQGLFEDVTDEMLIK